MVSVTRSSRETALKASSVTDAAVLPDTWQVVQLGEVAQVKLGRTPARAERRYWDHGEVPWVSIADLTNGPVRSTRERISAVAHQEVFHGDLVPVGTLLMSFKLTVGKVGVLQIPAVHNEAIASFALDDSRIDRDFLFYLLQSLDYDACLDSYVKGKTLNKEKLAALPIVCPPLPEQRAIAHVLRTVQKAKEATEAVIAATRELKKSLMRHLFTYGPVPVDQADQVPLKETEIGPVPEHWGVVSVGEVCERPQYGYTTSAVPDPVGPRFLRITDIQDDYVNWTTVPFAEVAATEQDKYRLQDGDIVVARIGATTGKTYRVVDPPLAVFASYLIRLRAKRSVLLPTYLHAFTRSELYWRQINQTKGGRLKLGVNIPALQALRMPLPPLEEQEQISAAVDALDRKIRAEKARMESLDTLLQSLLHHLMTCKVRLDESRFSMDRDSEPVR